MNQNEVTNTQTHPVKHKKRMSTHNLATMAILAAIAAVLFMLEIGVFPAVPFYKLDFSNLPVLLGMLGLEDWPDKVKQVYSDWFASVGDVALPPANDIISGTGNMVMDVWYPDWAYLALENGQAKRLLKALELEAPNPTEETIPDVPDTVFTLHIAFDGGQEFDLAYMGQTDFYLRDFKTDQVYTLSSEALRQAVETAISESKAIQLG